jgi:hypothetical protein
LHLGVKGVEPGGIIIIPRRAVPHQKSARAVVPNAAMSLTVSSNTARLIIVIIFMVCFSLVEK